MSRFHSVGVLLLLPFLFWATKALSTDNGSPQTLSSEQLEILAQADPEQSARVAKKCARCHGDNGISDDAEVPHLAGQNPRYVFKQLWDYKNLYRDGGRIKKITKKLTEQDIANLTARFSATALPTMDEVEPLSPPELVKNGDAQRDVDACMECHQNGEKAAKGEYELPTLAGMPYDYFVETMLAFKDGMRYNDPDEVMAKIANAISEREIEDLAEYYLALGKREKMSEEQ